MTLVKDTLWQDPFFTSSTSFDDFRKEMLRESGDMITHIKEQFEVFDSDPKEGQEGNKTVIEKTEIREGYKLEKDKQRDSREITGPTSSSTSSSRKKLNVLPLSYDGYDGGDDETPLSLSRKSLMEDNQVIKVSCNNYMP